MALINSNNTLFSLIHLQTLNLDDNDFNYSHIPPAIKQLSGLTYLNLTIHLRSLVRNLTSLEIFRLSHVDISSTIPDFLANFSSLTSLLLEDCELYGELSRLTFLNLAMNNFSGNIASSLHNLTQLIVLCLHSNHITGPIPPSLGNLTKLELSGFLRHQNELEWFELCGNKIYGQIPKWMWNTSVDTLEDLNIGDNFITVFHQQPAVLPWVNLDVLELSLNMLQGPLPIPLPSIKAYIISGNMMTGKIPHVFCNLSSLYILDLSDNNIDGMIPQCFRNLSSSLAVLSLRNNSFHGVIPQTCSGNASNNLMLVDLSYNQLQGQLPRSLSNCMMLEGIVVSNNRLNDVFPSWLGSLPKLKLLTLRKNEFYGAIGKPEKDLEFPKLQVIDLSCNNFSGELPSQYIISWNSMKVINSSDFTYMSAELGIPAFEYMGKTLLHRYSITITSKGVEIYDKAIQDIYAFVDLSSNKFERKLPQLFGNLKALRSLNLSNNMVSGRIPSSLGDLTMLE
ncbi:receptor-like protein 6 [Ziziphus jujuba]|uniref:Receptor-like protein 6 n=1 Tax=Ziziphus jujuba TaxID=326968 RepID=A0ABM3ZTR0_ZIZJJ|nr:receptor-like protein 6 [Ziziphus jujuba]